MLRQRRGSLQACYHTSAYCAAGASQLLKPASTAPRSYGRMHRFWHHGHVHVTHNERRRGQRPLHYDQLYAWRRGHRLGHRDQVPATHNERRRERRPEHHDQVPCELNAGASNNWAKAHIHKSWARFLLNPSCSVAAFVVNPEPHTGARPSVRLCVGPELARCFHVFIWSS
jgi:hypothetical protein